ncbi:T3SS effector HopA1 family protein [Nocardia fluminea]|uniref:T3SS effector HopA1 family protein n=1 Tax=Nocardia fluminea TaxID=134984 RepID=UPI003406840E
MRVADSSVVSNALDSLLGATSSSGDDITIEIKGEKLSGPADRIRNQLSIVFYDLLHARPYTHTTPVATNDKVLPRKPVTRSSTVQNLMEIFHSRQFVVSRPLVDITETAVLYRQGRILMRAPLERVAKIGKSSVDLTLSHYSIGISPGFFYVYGSSSLGDTDAKAKDTRVYLSIRSPDVATQVFTRITERLDDDGTDFDMKILSAPEDYPRSDSIVLYTDRDAADICDSIHHWCAEYRQEFIDGSLLTRHHHRGISTADEPDIGPGTKTRVLSFGQHRTEMIAYAVVEHATTGGDLATALERSARRSGIDPSDYSRNLRSTDHAL